MSLHFMPNVACSAARYILALHVVSQFSKIGKSGVACRVLHYVRHVALHVVLEEATHAGYDAGIIMAYRTRLYLALTHMAHIWLPSACTLLDV